MGFKTNNQYQQRDNSNGFGFGTMLAIGGLTAFAFYMNNNLKQELAEAEAKTKDVKIPWAEKLADGQMKALKVGDEKDQKVLISRYQGKLYATGNFCSHFGVPLEGGYLVDDQVLCPAHLAGFSIVTGEIERAPGLDGLPTFPVVEKDGNYFVQIPVEGLPKKKTQALTKRDPENKTHFVIVGGGPAGLNCAETLRQSGFSGQITVLSKEDVVPYDRTLLSKALAGGDASKWALRPEEYLKDADIDYKLKTGVFSVNTEVKKVITVRGKHIYYDKLLIATGSNLHVPSVKGLDRDRRGKVTPKNVFFLRTDQD